MLKPKKQQILFLIRFGALDLTLRKERYFLTQFQKATPLIGKNKETILNLIEFFKSYLSG